MNATATWTGAWVGAAGLGVLNGAAREVLCSERLGERAAHRVSTATLIAALTAYAAVLERHRPIPTDRDARTIGGVWATLTVAFEFLFGHYAGGEAWGDLVRAYDVRRGRPWALVPISMAILPAAVRRMHTIR